MYNVSVGPNKDKKTSMCAWNVLCGLLQQIVKKVKAKPERISLFLMLKVLKKVFKKVHCVRLRGEWNITLVN